MDAQIIKKAELIIWDEVTMANKILEAIMKNNNPFGGKVLLLGGDFRQSLPVLPHGHRAVTVQTSLKYLILWTV